MKLHLRHYGRRAGDVLALRTVKLVQRYLERTDQAVVEGHLIEVGDDGTTDEERRFLELALAGAIGGYPDHPAAVGDRGPG